MFDSSVVFFLSYCFSVDSASPIRSLGDLVMRGPLIAPVLRGHLRNVSLQVTSGIKSILFLFFIVLLKFVFLTDNQETVQWAYHWAF